MNKQSVVDELKTFLAIKSVSTDPQRKDQIQQAAQYLKKRLQRLGAEVTVLQKIGSHPLVLGALPGTKGTKTIGIYGHYDVQPEDPVAEWQSEPFKLDIRNGKMYARGIADNKGHVIQNLAAIESLVTEKKLHNTIVFIFEGEEEIGSANYEAYMKEAKDILSSVDIFFITDMGMRQNTPQVFYGLRGLVYFELQVNIGMRDLHSGVFGNKVLNPVQVIADLLSKIKNVQTGRVMIPEFYTGVRQASVEELQLLKKTQTSDDEEKKIAGTYAITSIDDVPTHLVSKLYPSFDVHGIVSGYTGIGAKTIIPASATVKFSCRLVEYQDPKKIEQLITSFIEKNIAQGVKWQLQVLSSDQPFYCDINHPLVQKTIQILSSCFTHETLISRSGGSVPAAEILSRLYKQPVLLTGFTLPDDNIHAPNENFDEEMFWKGIEALKKIYSTL